MATTRSCIYVPPNVGAEPWRPNFLSSRSFHETGTGGNDHWFSIPGAQSGQTNFSSSRSFHETGTGGNDHWPSNPGAQSGQTDVSFSESFFKVGVISGIVHREGLPIDYLRWIQAPTSAGVAGRSYHVAKLSPTDSISYGGGAVPIAIYPGIIEELRCLPSAHLFGQAVLLRDLNERTAMLSIAEAAFAQLCGLHELLELLIMMIEHALREKGEKTQWQFSWQQPKLEETPPRKNIPLGTKTYGQPPNAQDTMLPYMLPFMKTKTLNQIEDIEGSPVHTNIQTKIHNGFFQVDPSQDWTCYRRNYFSVSCSYSLEPFSDTNFENLRLRSCGDPALRLYKIQAIAICISARADGEHGKVIQLLQHTPKRYRKGPIPSPGRVKLMPRPLGSLGVDDASKGVNSDSRITPTEQQSQTTAEFGRLQFKDATANNGKRRAAQQYYHIVVELFAETFDNQTSVCEWIKFATRISAPIIVRGRSVGYYMNVFRTLAGGSDAGDGKGVQSPTSVLEGRTEPFDVEPLEASGNHLGERLSQETTDLYYPQEFGSHSIVISIEKRTVQWYVVIESNHSYIKQIHEISETLQWLAFALGSKSEATPISPYLRIIDLEQENASVLTYRDGCDDRTGSGSSCWRQKIKGGRILRSLPIPHQKIKGGRILRSLPIPHQKKAAEDKLLPHGLPAVHHDFSHPFPYLRDGLVLTAAALWSLFDNSIQRVPDCQCTFKSEGGDYIQCKRKDDQAFLWHVFTSDASLCRGLRCASNIKLALGPKENGDRLFTTSLCVLAWTAESRTTPEQPIAAKFSVTSEFEKGHLIKYEQESLEAQAHIGVPAVGTPQVSVTTTFSKRRYKVANSIEEDSITATNVASSRMVLIYCEARGLHLMMYGADLVEGICIELLKQLLCVGFPTFTHGSALSRLRTWQSTSFVSATGNAIPGEELVRQATKRINKLIETTNTVARDLNGKLSYWVLEHLLCGRDSQALKAPKNHIHTSWHAVASKSSPLILAVGEIDARLIARETGPLQCINLSAETKPLNLTALMSLLRKPSTLAKYGAVLGTKEALTRWLHQIGIAFCGQITETKDRVRYGDGMFEKTYRISEAMGDTASVIPASMGCLTCHHDAGVQCLYYLQ